MSQKSVDVSQWIFPEYDTLFLNFFKGRHLTEDAWILVIFYTTNLREHPMFKQVSFPAIFKDTAHTCHRPWSQQDKS